MRMLALAAVVGFAAVDEGVAPPVDSEGAKPQAANRGAEVRPFEDIVVNRETRVVEIRAWVCLDRGFLEQVACSPGTREHESLLVVRAKPSEIHASLLLAGFEAGTPGRWVFDPEQETVELIQPQGPELDVHVRYSNDEGEQVERDVRDWIRDNESGKTFPDQPWVFGGSAFRPNPQFMGPGEHYVADMTGSIIGLVTFGDEVIGLKQVISDQAAIHEPEWEVNADVIPKEGTEVTVILRPRVVETTKESDGSGA